MRLTFDEALDEALPAETAFTVTVSAPGPGGGAGEARTPDSLNLASDAAELHLILAEADAIRPGESVTVSYAPPTGQGANPVQDAAGNPVAGFGPLDAANGLPVAAPEAPGNFTAAPGTFAGAMDLSWDAAWGNGRDVAGYNLQYRSAGGSWSRSIVVRDAAAQGSGHGFAHSLTGLAGGADYEFRVQAFTGRAPAGLWATVTAETADDAAPLPTGAEVRPEAEGVAQDGTPRGGPSVLVLSFDESLYAGPDGDDRPAPGAFSVTVTAGADTRTVALAAPDANPDTNTDPDTVPVALDGAELRLRLAAPVRPGESVSVSYAPADAGAHPLQDRAGFQTAAFAGVAVRNLLPAAAPEAPGNLAGRGRARRRRGGAVLERAVGERQRHCRIPGAARRRGRTGRRGLRALDRHSPERARRGQRRELRPRRAGERHALHLPAAGPERRRRRRGGTGAGDAAGHDRAGAGDGRGGRRRRGADRGADLERGPRGGASGGGGVRRDRDRRGAGRQRTEDTRTPESVAVAGAALTLTLAEGGAVRPGEAVAVAYDPAKAARANPLADRAGNPAAGFTTGQGGAPALATPPAGEGAGGAGEPGCSAGCEGGAVTLTWDTPWHNGGPLPATRLRTRAEDGAIRALDRDRRQRPGEDRRGLDPGGLDEGARVQLRGARAQPRGNAGGAGDAAAETAAETADRTAPAADRRARLQARRCLTRFFRARTWTRTFGEAFDAALRRPAPSR